MNPPPAPRLLPTPARARGYAPALLASCLLGLLVGCSDGASPPPAPGSWDLGRLPDPGPTLREAKTLSGALYRVVAEGTGASPAAGEVLDVRYKGWLLSGASFDEGLLAGVEVGATPRRLIVGFDEGLAGMKVGEKRRILVPAVLGYGSRAQAGIPADSPLVFDVERVALAVETLDLRDGTGAVARVGSEITVHYKGTLRDGKVFDSSLESGKPATFRLERGRLIEGWIRGIPGMKAGGLRVLRIPSDLAYGKQGKPPKIPPDAPLQFEIDLLEVR